MDLRGLPHLLLRDHNPCQPAEKRSHHRDEGHSDPHSLAPNSLCWRSGETRLERARRIGIAALRSDRAMPATPKRPQRRAGTPAAIRVRGWRRGAQSRRRARRAAPATRTSCSCLSKRANALSAASLSSQRQRIHPTLHSRRLWPLRRVQSTVGVPVLKGMGSGRVSSGRRFRSW